MLVTGNRYFATLDTMDAIQVLDGGFAQVAQHAGQLECLCMGAVSSEGPVWMPERNELLWSDVPNNRMLGWSEIRGMQVWRDAADFTNGHVRERDGSLLHCSHGRRAIMRTRLNALGHAVSEKVVVDDYQGRRLNSPNDLFVKRDGSIWFTDPPCGIVSDREGHLGTSDLGPVPEMVGNLCFGGAAGHVLYICASTSLDRITLGTRGATA